MITKFIERFESKKESLRNELSLIFNNDGYVNYDKLFNMLVQSLVDDNDYSYPDPERIVKIDHGDYQGTLVFVVGASGYQPSKYWATTVGYGSCSGCDTLQDLLDSSVIEKKVDGCMTLMLHMLQKMKPIHTEYT